MKVIIDNLTQDQFARVNQFLVHNEIDYAIAEVESVFTRKVFYPNGKLKSEYALSGNRIHYWGNGNKREEMIDGVGRDFNYNGTPCWPAKEVDRDWAEDIMQDHALSGKFGPSVKKVLGEYDV